MVLTPLLCRISGLDITGYRNTAYMDNALPAIAAKKEKEGRGVSVRIADSCTYITRGFTNTDIP